MGTTALFGAGKSFLGGSFSLADDYATFDQKRSEHLKNVFYSRIRDQAVSALQQTVSTREYPAYAGPVGLWTRPAVAHPTRTADGERIRGELQRALA
jgi:hypothetical protein